MKAHLQKSSILRIRIADFCHDHCLFALIMMVLLLTFFTTKGQGNNTAPLFEMGSQTELSASQASPGKIINTVLKVTDNDRGQLLTWSVATPPNIGTLSGFPAFALSGNTSLIPDVTLLYHPAAGQTGNDQFDIQISDGVNISVITIRVTLLAAEPPEDPTDIDIFNETDTSKNISSIQSWENIRVPFGTPYTALTLPFEARVTYLNGHGEYLPIFWYPSNFNGRFSADYILIGDVKLAANSTNTSNKKARIIVTVLPNLEPTEIILSDSILGVQPFDDPDFPPNVFTTIDPDDQLHTYQLADGTGDDDNCKFSVNEGIVLLKDQSYLKTQKKFTIRVKSTDSNHHSIEKAFILYFVPKGKKKEVVEIQVPNVFSPNGDGINDVWIVPELKDYKEVDIKVYDRSGALIFHTTNPLQGWDGRNANGKAIAGAYFYIITVAEISLKKQGVLVVLTN